MRLKRKFAKHRERFSGLVFEDEQEEQRLRDRRRWRRRLRRKCLALGAAFVLGVGSSYCATVAWEIWPVYQRAQQPQPQDRCNVRPDSIWQILRKLNGDSAIG